MFIISSFDFSGFSDFTDQFITQSDDSVDGWLVGLDGGIGGDGGQDVHDGVPGFSLELRFGVFGQVGRNLSEGSLGFFGSLQERGFHGINDDLFGFFYNGQSFVVLSLFFSPFLVFQGFVGIQFVNLLVDQASEFLFSVSWDDFLVSYGDFFSQFSGQSFNSLDGGFNFGFQVSDVGITLVDQGPDEVIVIGLLLSQISFGFLQHSDQVFDGSFSFQLDGDGGQQGFSVFAFVHLFCW